jgi:manganese transport protein
MPTETLVQPEHAEHSLPEVFASIQLSRSPHYWRRLLGFIGPGFMIAVGYMDPGNWATDIAGGSRFGYTLLFVIMTSNLMAILLQSLSLKLGIVMERDLAQMCHQNFGPRVSFGLWVFAEIGIAACDLAEVIGSAIALQLLFHIPLIYGVLITGADVLLILVLQRWGFRYVEALVIVLIGTIVALFGVQLFLSKPEYWPVLKHLLAPSPQNIYQPRHDVYRHRHFGRNSDAAQPLPAFFDCAKPQLRAHTGGQARGHPDGQYRFRGGADAGVVCECGHTRGGGGGVSSQRTL